MIYDLTNQKCIPCEGGEVPLDAKDEDSFHSEVPVWGIHREGKHYIERNFKFKDFSQAMKFVNGVAKLAEDQGHHPEIGITWNKVTLILHTHAIGGLSKNDFIMAAKIDEIYKKSE
jgi:4a-hydroxytetrahydrobiopterin dehydratase